MFYTGTKIYVVVDWETQHVLLVTPDKVGADQLAAKRNDDYYTPWEEVTVCEYTFLADAENPSHTGPNS